MSARLARIFGILGSVLLLVGAGGLIGESILGIIVIPYFFIIHIGLGLLFILAWFAGHGFNQLGKKEGIVSSRNLTFGTSAIVYSLLFLTLIVGVNWFTKKHNKRWDLTEEGVFSLAPQSTKIIKNLEKPLKITAFQPGNVNPEIIKETLNLYKEVNPNKVEVQTVNPVNKPHLVESYGMKRDNLVHISLGEGENKNVSRIDGLSEQQITNAILKLTRGSAKKVYYVTGHGEPELEGKEASGVKLFADALNDQHFKIEPLATITSEKIPADAASVMLVGPKRNLQEAEIKLLIDYAKAGGSLVLMADPRYIENIAEIAAKFNIEIKNNILIDIANRRAVGPSYGIEIVTSSYDSKHQVVKDFSLSKPVIFSQAVGLSKLGDQNIKGTVTELVTSSKDSWAETDLTSIFESEQPVVSFNPESDVKGPHAVAMAYENEVKSDESGLKTTTKVVVFGDSDWLGNSFANPAIGLFNMDLALNVVSWASGEEGAISIRPRAMKSSSAILSTKTLRSIMASGFIIPEIILLIGIAICWRRKGATV